jgi:DNA-directed RNA polymerase specialized sigma24 family protein
MDEVVDEHAPSRDEAFDAFYKDARDRLLLQAYALTGDLVAARSAVRDAFVVAWHHWRKVSRLDDPEASVRPQTWRNALRRANTRPWHREKKLDPGARATLDALAALPVVQRKALVLTQLAAVSMPEMARELGLPLETAERELQLGASQFSVQREISAASIPMHFAALAEVTRTVTWPRVTILRRAGAARRRAHTVVGVVAAAAVVFASGVAVSDSTGVRPNLARDTPLPAQSAPTMPGVRVALPDTSLLPPDVVRENLTGRGWREGRTTDNSTGTGMAHPCQADRYADPRGEAAWVRTFQDAPKGEEAGRRLTQTAEASATEAAARRTFVRARSWFAGCALPQTQLISTSRATALGDDAAVFVLRSSGKAQTYVVALARTGLFTTALSLETAALPPRADAPGLAGLLAESVDRLCALPDGGACASTPADLETVPPYPTGEIPAMVSGLDLPPVGTDNGPWAAPEAVEITPERTNIGVVGCNSVAFTGSFRGRQFRHNLVRTWVLPKSDLPAEVGITQTVASLPDPAAEELVALVRGQVSSCPEEDTGAGTVVRRLSTRDERGVNLSAWALTTRLPGDTTVKYDVAILRDGSSISQLIYVSAPGAVMRDTTFVALAERALERLSRMPGYRK